MSEKWTESYIILTINNKRTVLKTVHYLSFSPDYPRQFYRVYGPDFDYTMPASSQHFGFGSSIEEAVDKFFLSYDRRIW